MSYARPAFFRLLAPTAGFLLTSMAPSLPAQDTNYFPPPMPSPDVRAEPPPPPIPVYFPPAPPPLERINVPPPLSRRSAYPAPETLSAYSTEIFYSALAARTDQVELKKRNHGALDRYREDKRTLQHELRSELAYILQQPPDARRPLLSALAQKQDPRIADLEARAEDIRHDITRSDYAWTALRTWKLGETKRASESPAEIANVMLSASGFQNGLSTPQRQLLREIAIELSKVAENEADALAAQPYVFFSPSPARVRFPEKIPDAVAAKISRYESRKSALRKELYDAIYRQDAAWFDATRVIALRNLATRQAPEFAILEELAEEIRRDLAPMPPLARQKSLVELPPALAQRLSESFHRITAEQLRIKQELGKIQERYPELRISGYFSRDVFLYDVRLAKSRYFSPRDVDRRKQADEEVSQLGKHYADTLTVHLAERNGLRPEIAAAIRSNSPSDVSLALVEGFRRSLEQDSGPAIDDYFVAVFEPGLSPGQRRLLFGGAIEQLGLPLPGGSLQPTGRSNQRVGLAGP